MCLEPGVSADGKPRCTEGATGRTLKGALPRTAALLGMALLGFLLPAYSSGAPSSSTPHEHFRRPDACPKCHLAADGLLSRDRFTAESEGFCLGCHRREFLGPSHPINVAPNGAHPPMEIPGTFPLSADGRLMCLTCHAAHGPYLAPAPSFPGQEPFIAGIPEGSRYKTYFLRRTSPKDGFEALCRACHRSL